MTITERPPLSARQFRLLAFIESYIIDNGWAPNYREMCDGAGLKSTSSVAHQLDVLEARGYVRRGHHGDSRAIAVIA